MSDLDGLLKLINTLAAEDTFILTRRKKTRKEEEAYLKRMLKMKKTILNKNS